MSDELTPISQLGRALDFSYEDLRTNRSGLVTRRQRRQLWRRFWSGLLVFSMLLVVPVAVSWILVSWENTQSFSDVMMNDASMIGYLMGTMSAGFYASTGLRNFMLAADLVRGRVLAITGPVERYGRYLYMGERRYLLESGTLDLVQSELHYTLYILPVSMHILSMEFAE